MCGACGTGRSVPRWEDILAPPTRSVLAARAASTDRLLDGGSGLRVRSWLSAGYLLSDRVGRTAHAADLDALWRAAGERGARPKGWRPLRGADTTVSVEAPGGWDLAAAAVWFAAVARAEPDASLEVTLPDPGGARTLLVTIDSGVVGATAVADSPDGPPPGATALVSGAGAVEAARHLEELGGRRPRRRA
ncbi:hypothetical protein GCM10027073_12580 [Streptomyces chlorus]|uniref:Uncharacterized protein n=1 Tax=Streptomyces chlorus TaxID=887452 RepID=A0ABW1DNV5_9ACTN